MPRDHQAIPRPHRHLEPLARERPSDGDAGRQRLQDLERTRHFAYRGRVPDREVLPPRSPVDLAAGPGAGHWQTVAWDSLLLRAVARSGGRGCGVVAQEQAPNATSLVSSPVKPRG